MTHIQKRFFSIGIFISIPFLVGCADANTLSGNQAAVSEQRSVKIDLPENDCLGLTPEKVQTLCGSGVLSKKVIPINTGYQCVYSAHDSNGADKPMIGTQLKLSYFTESPGIAAIKEEVKTNDPDAKITDMPHGFSSLKTYQLPMEREGWEIGLYSQVGGLTIAILGSDIDYEALDENSGKACSLDEMKAALTFVSARDSTATGTPQPPLSPKTELKTSPAPNCCEIIVAKVVGAVETKAGKAVAADDRLKIGDKLYTVDGLLIIGVVCSDDPENVKMFVVEADEPTEISVEQGADGKPVIKTDPGVANVSIKELPQFETDFQVSTPRLTCSVRG
ncbi:MAG: hypothetical protein Q7N87_03865 [Candidatus Uhrbacteria bacterium]|nr:hypothetical protein [Candidatus Uhrbacteria bacterium]